MSTTTPSRTEAAAAQHTPGPWKVMQMHGENTVFDSGAPSLIARVGKAHRSEDTANARLLAAAPELLEAARAVIHASAGIKYQRASDEPEWLKLCRAAISKATAA